MFYSNLLVLYSFPNNNYCQMTLDFTEKPGSIKLDCERRAVKKKKRIQTSPLRKQLSYFA